MPRNLFILFIHVPLSLHQVFSFENLESLLSEWSFMSSLLLINLSMISIREYKGMSPKIADFLNRHPQISPTDFFQHIYNQFGPLKYFVSEKNDYQYIDPEMTSFLKMKRQRQTYLPNLFILFDTCYLAYLCLHSLSFVGPKFCTEVFDLAASMWGKRTLEVMHAKIIVNGREKIKNLKGKIIFIMNHKSSLDFNLLFFALSQLKDQSQREIKPRFIAAKDHFKSALSYHIIGIGRLIETVGMIFIDRQKEKRGIMNLNQASDSLANQDVDIAIYPQGTRAEGNLDRSGKRRDAGYYTTISPNYIDSDYDHIRKGASFLAINTLFSLKKLEKKDPVHIVFIGIEGTATAFPKQSFKIQTETEIEFNIGEILTLDQRVIENIEPLQENYYNLVNDLYEEMDRKLVNSIHIRENLSHRLYLELNGNLRYPENRILKIKENINALDKNTSIVYQILDRIFACSANYWNANLTKLAQILLEENPLSRLQELRIEISQLMLKNLKKKAHGKKVKV